MAQPFLHNLPHLNHTFHRVSNELIVPQSMDDILAWNTNSYLQSIQMFAFIPIVLGLIYAQICIVLLSTYCCSDVCRNLLSYGKASNAKKNDRYQLLTLLYHKHSSSHEETIKLTKYSKVVRVVLACLVPITLIVCAIYGSSFKKSLIRISDDWSNSYSEYERMMYNTQQVHQYYIPSAQRECTSILNTRSAIPIWKDVKAVHSLLSTFSTHLTPFIDASESVPNWSVISNDITPYSEWAVLLPVCALVVFGLIMILNHFCFTRDYLNKRTCCWCCSVSVVYLPLFIFVLVCIQFAISVFIADGCDDPNDSLWRVVDTHVTAYAQEDITTQQMIKYYIYCGENETIHNPLYTEEFHASYDEFLALNESVSRLTDVSEALRVEEEANALYNYYHESLVFMNEINVSLQCDTIGSYKENMVSELCEDGLQYWMIFYVLQVVCVALIIIRSWCICTEDIKEHNQRNDGEDVPNDGGGGYECNDYGTAHSEMELQDAITLSTIYSDPLLVSTTER